MIALACEIPVENGTIKLQGNIFRSPGNHRDAGYAIIAHPWPALGGNMDDRVVRTLTSTLIAHDLVVLTYNSRGTGRSTGKASWTGQAEKEDYGEVVEWFLAGEMSSGRVEMERDYPVYCCGYSFGALAASNYLPSTRFDQPAAGLSFSFKYILISPPVGWTVIFLIPFRFKAYVQGTRDILDRPCPSPSSSFRSAQPGVDSPITTSNTMTPRTQGSKTILLIYGTNDQFSSSSDYDRYVWAIAQGQGHEQGEEDREAKLQVNSVEGGDHLWAEQGMRRGLMRLVDEFIRVGEVRMEGS